jgi:hypothetical protein
MQAVDIAAKSGLPKELLQGVQLLKVLAAKPLQFKYNSFAEVHVEQGFTTKLRNYISTMPTIW